MTSETQDTVARTVLMEFPSGTEYWMTDREFTVGGRIRHNGEEWIVVVVGSTSDGTTTVAVREPDRAPGEREQTFPRDQEAWNLPRRVIPAQDPGAHASVRS